MPDIALRTYVQQLDNLIERKHVDEAVAHCRHILSYFPKHLDTYRMLGKALLEKGRHGDAADVFQRVLSVLPDDFIAHVGMAIVREDEANLEAALWHMERAFEAMPSNGAIQQELCRLYGRRDGVVPPKARLTRGALGRMYIQGGLYRQAEAELKAALAEDQERIDLSTLLAKAYWLDGQIALAAPLCGLILQKLPYSQAANRILADIFAQQQQPAEGAGYRQRLQALDPYEAHVPPGGDGVGIFAAADQAEASKVELPRLEYVAGMEASGSPDWIASIGARFEEPVAADKSPNWLDAALAGEDEAAPGAGRDWLADIEATTSAEAGASSGWLHDLSSAGADTAPAAPEPEPGVPDWLQPKTGPLPSDAVPDWMLAEQAAADETLKSGPPAMPPDEVPAWIRDAVAPEAATAEDMPGWLQGLEPGSTGEPAGQEAGPPEVVTARLSEPVGGAADATLVHTPPGLEAADRTVVHAPPAETAAAPLASSAPPPASEAAPPPWLQEATAAAGAEELPDWLKTALSPASRAPAPDEITTRPLVEPDAQTTMAAEPPASVVRPAEEQTLIQPPPVEQPAAPQEPEAQALEPTPAEELPAWLQSSAPPSIEDRPSWLDDLAGIGAGAALAAQALEPSASEPAAPEETLPGWLAEATSTGPLEAGTPWLQTIEPAGIVASSPEPPAPTEPAVPTEPSEQPPAAEAAMPEAELGQPDWSAAATAAAPVDERPSWVDELAPPSAVSGLGEPAAQPSSIGAAALGDELPDWLADATAPGALEASAPWLQTVEAASIAPSVSSEPPVSAAPPTPEPERPAEAGGEPPEGEGLPDWLAAAMAPGTADERPAWLKSALALPAEDEAEAASGQEVEAARMGDEQAQPAAELLPGELPDWLRAVAAAAPPPDVEASTLAEPPAAPPARPPVELPDFLQLASPEAIARAEQPFILDEPEQAEAQPVEEAAALEPAEIPDWLKAMAPEPAEPTPSLSSAEALAAAADINFDEVPDWLKPAAPEATAPEAEEQATMEQAAVEVPDWLQVNPAEGVPADLPPWAQGVEPGPTDTVANWLAGKEVPEWRRQAREQAQGEAAPVSPQEAADLPAAEAQPAAAEVPTPAQGDVEEVSPAELAEAGAAPAVAEPPAAPLDDWLRQAEAGLPVDALADTAPHRAPPPAPPPPALSDWHLAEEGTADLESTHEPEPEIQARPDWLPVDAAAEPEQPEPAIEADLAAMSADEALRWLEGLAARQGAKPEELLTVSPAEAEPPEATAALPAAMDETTGMESAAEPPAAQPGMAAVAQPAGEPDLAAMDADEALRWLEGLAAQQGARPEELLTTPHERPIETPAWIAAEQGSQPPAERPEPELPAMPAWLADIEAAGETQAEAPAPPEWLEGAAAQAETTLPAESSQSVPAAQAQVGEADLGAMDAEDAMRWLESLAARQGAPAEELMTAPGEQPVAPPDWITAEQASVVAEPPPPVEAAATPAPGIEATGLAAAAQRPEAEMPASERREHESAVPPTSYAPGGDVDKLSRLADRLAAARKAKEAEIEARFAEQRAEQEAARRQVWESMQAKKAAVEAATQAPAAPERPEQPKTGPLLPLTAEISALVPPVEDEAWTPALPPPRRGRRRPTSRYASQDPERVLDLAREYLADGEPASAAEAMEHLVRSGAKVDAVIQVLEGATRAHPRDVPLWRALGDAYVHSNRLQDALDTYRQALNRL